VYGTHLLKTRLNGRISYSAALAQANSTTEAVLATTTQEFTIVMALAGIVAAGGMADPLP